jgi:predicted RNA methylase
VLSGEVLAGVCSVHHSIYIYFKIKYICRNYTSFITRHDALARRVRHRCRNVLDMGCGTGILGIAAALLGAGHVLGIDVDAGALAVAAANIDTMEVDETVDLLCCDVRSCALRGTLATAGGPASAGGDGNAEAAQVNKAALPLCVQAEVV